MKKTTFGAVTLALASTLGLGAATAQAEWAVVASAAPPAPVYEVVPAPRTGYVWSAGHHEWRGNQYVWVPGQWLTARSGYIYEQPRWSQRNGQWVYTAGSWQRGPNGDRDGDGVANRYDRDRDGDGIPNRYDNNGRYGRDNARLYGPNGDLDRDGVANARDRDRDGDGVTNYNDRFPDERRRS